MQELDAGGRGRGETLYVRAERIKRALGRPNLNIYGDQNPSVWAVSVLDPQARMYGCGITESS